MATWPRLPDGSPYLGYSPREIDLDLAARAALATLAEGTTREGEPDGVERIRRERERQKAVEGWTPEHDDLWQDGELRLAALCYATPDDMSGATGSHSLTKEGLVSLAWPRQWEKEWWWKPSPFDPIRDLEKAGALIAAEIDRRQRASLAHEAQGGKV
jgi:hypothetical protein